MILSAEAARLAAIEVLRPTTAVDSFPTLAGPRVFDSRAAAINDLDDEPGGRPHYTPVLALYTRSSDGGSRGAATDIGDNACTMVLEIVGELAVIASDEAGDYLDAMAGDDPEARLVLAALMAQVRHSLLYAEAGSLFRRVVMKCMRIDAETHAVPELGLRFQRMFMRMTLVLPDDEFTDAGGFSGSIKRLYDALPAQSYAKAKLSELAGHLAGQARTPLAGIDFETPAEAGADPVAAFTTETGD
ncbi:MAG: hypothetical protein CML29_17470 [Rhizobiales bacterium]|nr:hypothetical protein [Hyphomicrobiales bacterium]MBA68628.1 hypothetical protein [Hyphomicrobiales bacterium]